MLSVLSVLHYLSIINEKQWDFLVLVKTVQTSTSKVQSPVSITKHTDLKKGFINLQRWKPCNHAFTLTFAKPLLKCTSMLAASLECLSVKMLLPEVSVVEISSLLDLEYFAARSVCLRIYFGAPVTFAKNNISLTLNTVAAFLYSLMREF